jgi:D-serine dehydratase
VLELTGEVVQLNDQHAYLRSPEALQVGDRVVLGISHPCAAFDKWAVVPEVDDDYNVVDAIRTYF